MRELEREGLLLKSADGREWVAARKRPQRHVDLRGCGASCTIVDAEGNPIGSVDGHQAYKETHPGAVYLHRGKTYVVKSLDMAAVSYTHLDVYKRQGPPRSWMGGGNAAVCRAGVFGAYD